MSQDSVDKKENKKLQNYLIVLFMFLICIGVVLYISKIYKIQKEEQQKIPILRDVILEIYKDDLEHYVMDNSTSVIYMCTTMENNCQTFEKSFKKLLQKNNYNDEIIYLNLTDLDQEEFVKEFNKEYSYKMELTTNYPAFVLFEDGKIKTILQGNSKKPLTIDKVKNFLELNEIGE